VDRSSFTAADLHRLLSAGLPAHAPATPFGLKVLQFR
jgi:hypothetical protein